MKTPRTHALPALFACAALAGLSGCASAPGPASGTATAPASYPAEAYAWRDPGFYDTWYDPKSVALPPPAPFRGFGSDGQPIPLLPTRARPAAAP